MGRHARPLALLAVVALAGGLSACGSDDELSAPIPKNSPDLTIPTGTTPSRPSETTPSTTTSTTATTAAGAVAPPAAAAAPPATPPPAAATGSPQTGGQAPTTGGQSTTAGAGAGGGAEFQNFCAENPGAC